MFRRPERNLLRRTSDRVESVLVFVLVFAFLAGAPLLAWRAGQNSYRSDVRTQRWEREHLRQVQATLGADAGTVAEMRTAAPQWGQATWTGPDGASHKGIVQVSPGDRAGTMVPIWIDGTGSQHAPPMRQDPLTEAVLTGVTVTVCLGGGLVLVLVLGRRASERRHDRAWTRQWLEVGPRWSRDSRWDGRH